MGWDGILRECWRRIVRMCESGELELNLEEDLRDSLYEKCVESGLAQGLAEKDTHWEYRLDDMGMVPDLYFEGDSPVVVELKLVKRNTGGYTSTYASFRADAKKLKRYAKMGWTAYLLAIDESTLIARPDRKNHFNPSVFALKGGWQRLTSGAYVLTATCPRG